VRRVSRSASQRRGRRLIARLVLRTFRCSEDRDVWVAVRTDRTQTRRSVTWSNRRTLRLRDSARGVPLNRDDGLRRCRWGSSTPSRRDLGRTGFKPFARRGQRQEDDLRAARLASARSPRRRTRDRSVGGVSDANPGSLRHSSRLRRWTEFHFGTTSRSLRRSSTEAERWRRSRRSSRRMRPPTLRRSSDGRSECPGGFGCRKRESTWAIGYCLISSRMARGITVWSYLFDGLGDSEALRSMISTAHSPSSRPHRNIRIKRVRTPRDPPSATFSWRSSASL